MIIDCHTHIRGGDGQAAWAEYLRAGKVDVCLVLAEPRQGAGKDVNKELSEYVGKHNDKMVGFGIVDPVRDKVGLKQLAAMKDKLGLKGIVLYCSAFGFHPTHSRAMQLYEVAQEIGMPVFFHNASPLTADTVLAYAQPYLLDEVARSFASLKIVIGNMGAPFLTQTFCMVCKHKNVYADLTISPQKVWEVYNVVVSASEWGVMDKLLFGSEFPKGDAAACIEALLGFNKLLADTNLPTVPRGSIRNIIERDSLDVLDIK